MKYFVEPSKHGNKNQKPVQEIRNASGNIQSVINKGNGKKQKDIIIFMIL